MKTQGAKGVPPIALPAEHASAAPVRLKQQVDGDSAVCHGLDLA